MLLEVLLKVVNNSNVRITILDFVVYLINTVVRLVLDKKKKVGELESNPLKLLLSYLYNI